MMNNSLLLAALSTLCLVLTNINRPQTYATAFAPASISSRHIRYTPTRQQLAAGSDNDDFFNDVNESTKKEPAAMGGNFFEKVDPKDGPPVPQKNEDEPPMSLEEMEELATPFDEHLPKLNTVTLVGRVGNAPEPRYFDDGKVVLNLSLACTRKYHPLERKVRSIRSGEEETDWFALEFWGRDAEYVTSYVEKGTRLGIQGQLTMDGWVDKMSGEQRRRAKVIVRQVDILETRAEAELRKSRKGGNNFSGGNNNMSNKRNTFDDDDDEDGPSPAGTGGFFS
ncbi:single-stranded DNA-binding protein [Skeletonema marinoi]|uniref:Single-stranded DNA-binding protein n=1 Tax=Skeletonema marinoi TaxID=267567 RepID=A0AAD9DCH1_9STRA|nr:single-stranded DNA-binding protein [Skeletonema marinoi]|eukprot:scaffold15181_cov116-Skeletonema_marinoi.AAC.2